MRDSGLAHGGTIAVNEREKRTCDSFLLSRRRRSFSSVFLLSLCFFVVIIKTTRDLRSIYKYNTGTEKVKKNQSAKRTTRL